jgi:hypothetical protein
MKKIIVTAVLISLIGFLNNAVYASSTVSSIFSEFQGIYPHLMQPCNLILQKSPLGDK